MSDSDKRQLDDFHTSVNANVELAYAGINTFLKAPHVPVGRGLDADVAVLGVPYDSAVSNRPGARYGPEAIRRASAWWAYLSGYKGGVTNMATREQANFTDMALVDCGDLPVFPMDRELTAENIQTHVAAVAETAFPLLLGGDHYCTYPSFIGVAKGKSYDRVGLVQIDAHSDTVKESAIFGEHFHGSSTHLIAESPVSDYHLVSQVGIRGYEGPDFFDFVDESGLNMFTMSEVDRRGIRDVINDAIDAIAGEVDTVYVTFDIDSVDPSEAAGTGTPVPGGLSAREALTAMRVLGERDKVAALDMMEVSPWYDPTKGTQRLAAYLLVSFLEERFL